MVGCVRALQTLAVERPVFSKERLEDGYGALPFFFAKVL